MSEASLKDQGELIQEVIRRIDVAARRSDLDNPGDDVNIGARLNQIRKDRQMTLQEASRATGVSASAFSKIERNELSPTISTLQRIAQGLGVEVVALLSEQENGGVNYGRRSVTRAGEGNPHKTSTCNNTLLCPDLRNKRITPILTRVTARTPEDYRTWAKSEAEIFLMVLEGTLVVHSRLYEPLTLNAGDSMYYDANSEHVWTSASPEDAKVLWVLTVA
jgi:transcriptional regulator with XRE-family HTH domain